MDNIEKLLLSVAAIGISWIVLFRHGSGPVMNPALQGTSSTVPWYLNYNTTEPAEIMTMASLPSLATGIENDTGNPPCTTCALFGFGYGSQY